MYPLDIFNEQIVVRCVGALRNALLLLLLLRETSGLLSRETGAERVEQHASGIGIQLRAFFVLVGMVGDPKGRATEKTLGQRGIVGQ
jgi:hypothetical protein